MGLLDEFKSDGYLVFFGLLGIMAREFDIKNPGIVTLKRNFIRRKLRLSWQKISRILDFCEEEGRFFVTQDGRNVIINCPKLKDMCDDWTQRLLRSDSEVPPEKPRIEVEEEVEEEEEKNIKQPLVVPYQEILNLYHEVLPELKRTDVFSKEMKAMVKNRCNQDKQRYELEWWRLYFKKVKDGPHLMGDNDRGWRATFDWLIRPKNMPKVLNGNYETKTETAGDKYRREHDL